MLRARSVVLALPYDIPLLLDINVSGIRAVFILAGFPLPYHPNGFSQIL